MRFFFIDIFSFLKDAWFLSQIVISSPLKFIYSEKATKFYEILSKLRGIFCKTLWPSQNIWTLKFIYSEKVTKLEIKVLFSCDDGQTSRDEMAFTARPKIPSHSQIFRYGRSIFFLPHQPYFSDIFDLCLHWVSVVCV